MMLMCSLVSQLTSTQGGKGIQLLSCYTAAGPIRGQY